MMHAPLGPTEMSAHTHTCTEVKMNLFQLIKQTGQETEEAEDTTDLIKASVTHRKSLMFISDRNVSR